MKLILATKNVSKIQEIADALSGLDVELVPMADAGIPESIVDDEKTFEANALKKARYVSSRTHEWGLGDHSGLCIDALAGEPGVNSSRWAGPNASDRELVDFALEKTKGLSQEKRRASFQIAIVLCHPNGTYRTFEGKVSGTLAREPKGDIADGPYSMIFIPDGYTKTFAEMTLEEKNSVSHRAEALKKVRSFLQNQVLNQTA